MAQELTFQEVRDIWEAAGGANTAGILEWFKPPVTVRWYEDAFAAQELGNCRFIGGDPGNDWERFTGGSYRLGDVMDSGIQGQFQWNPKWRIITVQDPENRLRVVIDGNKRAYQVQLSLAEHIMPPETELILITGELDLRVVRIAKAISPLWL